MADNNIKTDTTNAPATTTPVELIPPSKSEARKLYEEATKINLFRNQAIVRGMQICPVFNDYFQKKLPQNLLNNLSKYDNDAELFFNDAKKAIHDYYQDEQTLEKDIITASNKLKVIEDVFRLAPVPVQIVYGLMLRRYRELVKTDRKFLKSIKENFGSFSERSAYNYMKASMIVDYPGNESAYTAGIVVLYKLVELYQDDRIAGKNFKGLIARFRELVDETFPDEFNDDVADLIANYVVFLETDYKYYNPDKNIFKQLFKAGYRLKHTDSIKIHANSIDKTKKGKNKVNNPNYINTFYQAVIDNNFDSKQAYNVLTNTYTPPSNTPNPLGKEKFKTLSEAIATLKQTVNHYINTKKDIKNNEYLEIKNLLPILEQMKQNFEENHKV